MPRPSFTYHYSVVALYDASTPNERKYTGRTYYFGFSLGSAQRAFWRACRDIQGDPLAISVTVHRNSDVLMSVAPRGGL